jgi:aminopeptidase YwaD
VGTDVRQRIDGHLQVLVEQVGARPPGSPANRDAVAYAETVLRGCGLQVRRDEFETVWWEPGPGRLETAEATVEVAPNPYSPAGRVRGPLRRAERLEQLEDLGSAAGEVLVLAGELAREQIMPAAFPFLDLPVHTRVRDALHRLGPAAAIAVSDHWQPILEDPELTFPSTTVPTRLDASLREGEMVGLAVEGAVHRGTAANLSAHTGAPGRRVALSAHLDTKATTPGAFDDAGGVATLLALAEADLEALGAVEVVLFNGEDHFDAGGELAWLAATELAGVAANLNLDGVGLAGHGTSLATLACPEPLEAELDRWVAQRHGWTRAAPWFESDHAIFAMQGIPALAVTTEHVHELLGGLAHTPADTLDVLDLGVLEELAAAVPELVTLLHRALPPPGQPA